MAMISNPTLKTLNQILAEKEVLKMHDVSIVIVNYNTRELLLGCLDSVYQTAGDLTIEVWVVDNASTDDSAAAIQLKFPEVKLIANRENVGFSRANNQALAKATGKIWCLLNPDTIVMPGAFQALLKAFQKDSKSGLVGPQLLNKDGSIQPSFGKFTSVWTEAFFQFFLYKWLPAPFPLGIKIHPLQKNAYQHIHEVDWVSGACMIFRPEIIEQAGMLDEQIFMYGEDMEWCWHIQKAGFKILYFPEAQIIHLSGQSSRQNYASWINRYTISSLRFLQKYRGGGDLRLGGLFICMGSLTRSVLCLFGLGLYPGKRNELKQRMTGYQQAGKTGWQAFFKGTYE